MRVICLLLCLVTSMAQAEVYKSVNEDGEVIYSDRPGKDAERVRMPALPSYTPQPVHTTRRFSRSEGVLQTVAYDRFSITAPADEATIRNNIGRLDVATLISPALMVPQGHTIQFYLDGAVYGAAGEGTALTLDNIDRGTHRLTASVLDASGSVLITTPAVTVYVKRTSKLHGKHEGTVTDNPGYLTDNPNRLENESFEPYRQRDIVDVGRGEALDPDVAELPANPGYRTRNPNLLSTNPNILSSNPNLINPPQPTED